MSVRSIPSSPSRRAFAGLLLAGLAAGLSGCGRKPAHLDPAEDAAPEAQLYPRHYPNPKYDPAGSVPPSQAVVPPAPGSKTPAAAAAPAAPAQPAYPKIIHPEDLTPNAVLGGSGTWPTP